MTDIETRVLSVIGQAFGIDPSELDSTMVADDVDGWDSLSHVTVILMLSKEFGVKLSPAETEEIANIGALTELIRSKVA